MKPLPVFLIVSIVVAASVYVLAAVAPRLSSPEPRPSVPTRTELVERGEYLVHRVGLCIDCHSPRDATGAFIQEKHLTGRALSFVPPDSKTHAAVAPGIAGLPSGFNEQHMVHFLMTGERPNGRPPPLPPMPPYRLNQSDAQAVTAYLASLPVGGS